MFGDTSNSEEEYENDGVDQREQYDLFDVLDDVAVFLFP